MSETFQCGDHGTLIAYLYDECAPGERESIAAHLARCVSCAGEVNGLASTRQALAAWAPPDIDLGLQISRKTDAELMPQPAAVLAFGRPRESVERSLPWWRAPLPAWAQAAAALVIFAAGLSVGFVRDGARRADVRQATSPAPVVATPSKEDLAQLEQRLRTEMTQLARSSAAPQATPVAAHSGEDAIMQRVRAMLEESERQQRIEVTERFVRQAATSEEQRRALVSSMNSTFGQIGAEVRQHRQVIDENNRLLRQVNLQR